MSEPWMPEAEKIKAAIERWYELIQQYRETSDAELEPIRSLIRAAVEKAVAEERVQMVHACEELMNKERARHARELKKAKLEAQIEAHSQGLHILQSGGTVEGSHHGPEFRASWCARCRDIQALRAALAAMEEGK